MILSYTMVSALAMRRGGRTMTLLASHAKITKQNQNMLNLLPSFVNGVVGRTGREWARSPDT